MYSGGSCECVYSLTIPFSCHEIISGFEGGMREKDRENGLGGEERKKGVGVWELVDAPLS